MTGAIAEGLRMIAAGCQAIAEGLEAEQAAAAQAALPEVLTVAELAVLARQCADTVRAACAAGKVPGAFQATDGGRWRIPRAGAEQYAAGQGEAARPALRVAARAKAGRRPDYLRQLNERPA